jgi:hypothetical protein
MDNNRLPMPRALHIVLTIVFVGVMASLAINFLLSSYFGTEDNYKDYYDGNSYDRIFLQSFADSFYKDAAVRDYVVNFDYLFFKNIHSDRVLLGDDGFLFDIYDDVHNYNFIKDYVGDSYTGEDYLSDLASGIEKLRRGYAEGGSECVVVIIPNAQTIYGELMPDYFGSISENTLLKKLTEYMQSNGMQGYIDMTDALLAAKDQGQLYNNTENSLNSLGAYFVYSAIMEEYGACGRVIKRDELSLYSHITEGKALARRAGVEKLRYNLTVSVNFNFEQSYRNFPRVNSVEKTYNAELPYDEVVLVASTNDWDKIMMTDYFSNSFGIVGYRVEIEPDPSLFDTIKPDITFVFVREYELSKFAQGN